MQDKDGETALTLASEQAYNETVRALEEWKDVAILRQKTKCRKQELDALNELHSAQHRREKRREAMKQQKGSTRYKAEALKALDCAIQRKTEALRQVRKSIEYPSGLHF